MSFWERAALLVVVAVFGGIHELWPSCVVKFDGGCSTILLFDGA